MTQELYKLAKKYNGKIHLAKIEKDDLDFQFQKKEIDIEKLDKLKKKYDINNIFNLPFYLSK